MNTKYYDHESAYKKIKERGEKFWSSGPGNTGDIKGNPYYELIEFLRSPYRPENGKAIDLGCGGGQASFLLNDYGFEVVGVDYSQTAVEMARDNARELKKQIIFEKADILDLKNINSESFDFIRVQFGQHVQTKTVF